MSSRLLSGSSVSSFFVLVLALSSLTVSADTCVDWGASMKPVRLDSDVTGTYLTTFGELLFTVPSYNGELTVWDMQDPLNPIQLSAAPLSGYARDVVLIGSNIVAVCGTDGVAAFSFTPLGELEHIGDFTTEDGIEGLRPYGDLLVAVSSAGDLYVLAINNDITEVGHLADLDNTGRVAVAGDYALVTDDHGLQVVSLIIPTAPSHSATISSIGEQSLYGMTDIAADGSQAACVYETEVWLEHSSIISRYIAMLDVSDPTAPGFVAVHPSHPLPSSTYMKLPLHFDQDELFVGTAVYDRFTLERKAIAASRSLNDICVLDSGTLLGIGANQSLQVWDITHRSTPGPQAIGIPDDVYPVLFEDGGYNVGKLHNGFLSVDYMSWGYPHSYSTRGFHFWDCRDPLNPVQSLSFLSGGLIHPDLLPWFQYLGTANDLIVMLKCYSDTGSKSIVIGNAANGTQDDIHDCGWARVDGNRLWYSDVEADLLFYIDLDSDPTTPHSVPLDGEIGTGWEIGNGVGIIPIDGQQCLVDLSNPQDPIVGQSFDYEGQVLAFHENLLLTDTPEGLNIYDIEDVHQPSLLSHLALGTVWEIFDITGDEFIFHVSGGFALYCLADPLHPQLLSQCDDFDFQSVVRSQNHLYALAGSVILYDISDPTNPVIVGQVADTANAGYEAKNLAIIDNMLVCGGIVYPLDCTDVLPVYINGFDLHRSDRGVEISWDCMGNIVDLRVEASLAGRTWDVPFSATPSGFHAIDYSGEAASGQPITYRLYVREGQLWVLQTEETLASAGLPQIVKLSNVVPNPFNPQAQVSFSLPSAGEIDLTVYDLRGQRIRRLATGTWESGQHDVQWNGLDDRGSSVASGTYIFRLKTDSSVQTQRGVLVR